MGVRQISCTHKSYLHTNAVSLDGRTADFRQSMKIPQLDLGLAHIEGLASFDDYGYYC